MTAVTQSCPSPEECLPIVILDNGGGLLHSSTGDKLRKLQKHYNIQIITSTFNHGVAGSWNYFAAKLGRCIISNDDVIFGQSCIKSILEAVNQNIERIIIENDDPYGGFSLFCLNQPDRWLALGGFDEMFNPAYFEDNDTRWRLSLHGNPSLRIPLNNWHHCRASTMNHASGSENRIYGTIFRRNMAYYILKWGGVPGKERFVSPFNQK
jgi:GT2 family glycosyltransferase